MATPKPRQVRVDDDLWREFGEIAESMGTDRAKLLVAFMRRFVEAMRTPSPERPAAITTED